MDDGHGHGLDGEGSHAAGHELDGDGSHAAGHGLDGDGSHAAGLDHTDDHAHDGHSHSHGHGHGHVHTGPFDLHIWLDPVNAAAMVQTIAEVLSESDPDNADWYEDNMHDLVPRLEYLTAEIASDVAPARGRPFIVFHDGYRYFEDRFGLTAAGSAVVSPERSPGVRRIRELRKKVAELGVICVIDEPEIDRRLVNTVIEGTGIRSGTVDPMGNAIESGPELYFTLIHDMAATFKDCLAPDG